MPKLPLILVQKKTKQVRVEEKNKQIRENHSGEQVVEKSKVLGCTQWCPKNSNYTNSIHIKTLRDSKKLFLDSELGLAINPS